MTEATKSRSLSAMEQETIVLLTVWDMIDDMVNHALFDRLDGEHGTELKFKDDTHARLFNILLTDFLSQPKAWNRRPFEFERPDKGQNLEEVT